MNTKIEICVVAAIISGNILNCPYAFADNTEFFADQRTATKNMPLKKIQKNENDLVQKENLPWLAKVNYYGRFGSRIMLQQVGPNPYSKNYAKVPTVTLKIKDGLILFPYFFQELSIIMPNRKKMTSKSGNFSDEKIQSLLRKSNLGNITSWRTEWQNGNLRFLVNYNGENFQISPLSRPDLTLDEWTKKKAWSTSIYKKAVLGTLAVGAAAAAGYGIYKLVTTPQPVGLNAPNGIPESSEADLQKGQQADITPSDYFDTNIFRAHRSFEAQYPHIIFAGAQNLTYRYYVPMTRAVNLPQGNKNPLEIILNLEYDLSVAENQCNWNAKEIIARALLATVEKYGVFPSDQSIANPEVQAMVDAQNMAILHAAIALKQVLAQRKTTIICKNNSNLSPDDIYKVYLFYGNRHLALDRPLEQYLKTANDGEFVMGSSIFPIGSKGQFNDIMELAKIIDNLGFLYTLFSSSEIQQKMQQDHREHYRDAVVKFVDQNFNFTGKEFLRKITMDYFMKIYDKEGHSIDRIKSSNRLKLRDFNKIDIYGNIDFSGSYCATFELIRRNPENENFIAFGGMFDLPTIAKMQKEAIIFKKDRQFEANLRSMVIPYRRFNWNGQKVYDAEEDAEKLKPPMTLLDLYCTNDLSSRTRAQASYLVWVNSMNDWAQRSPFLQPNAKGKFLIPVDKDASPLEHWSMASCDSTFKRLMNSCTRCYMGQKTRTTSIPSTDIPSTDKITGIILGAWKVENLGPTQEMINKLNFILGAFGISFVRFADVFSHLKKRFLNETTTQPSESAWVDLGLGCAHITNPFSPIVGMAQFNGRARLILQD